MSPFARPGPAPTEKSEPSSESPPEATAPDHRDQPGRPVLPEWLLWPRGRAVGIAGACYLLGALVLTWRLWADPASRTVTGNWTDADLFAWYLRYAADAVRHGALPALVTTAVNAPQGVNLMWNTSMLLPGVVLAPVTMVLGPQVSLTILITAGFAGSATAMYIVLRRWRVSGGAAGLAGAVYGFSPAMLHSAIGHYNLQLAILPPLIIDAGLRLVAGRRAAPVRHDNPVRRINQGGGVAAPPLARRGPAAAPRGLRVLARRLSCVAAPVGDGVKLGVLVAAQVFISEEVALLTALTGVLLVAGLAAARPATAVRRLGPAVAGLLAAGAVTLALAGHALRTQFSGPLPQHGPLFPPDYYVNDLTGFVNPSAYLLFHTTGTAAFAARYQGGMTEYLAYLGWPLVIVLAGAAVAGWRRPAGRALALTLAFLVVFSLGGHLLVAGVADPTELLPWHWLEEHRLLSSVLPDRISILADGVAAALLAVGADAVREHMAGVRARQRPWFAVAAAAAACLPLLPLPLRAAAPAPLPAGWPAAFAALRLPSGSRVLVVPVPTNILTVAMRWQADTGQQVSLVGGYFIGPGPIGGQEYIGGPGVRPTATYLNRLWAAGLPPGNSLVSVAAAAGLPTASPAGSASAGRPPTLARLRADFAFWRPAALVAVTPAGSPLARYLVGLLGEPTVQVGSILAWRRAPPAG